jgi:hypothetical protein
MVGGRDGRADPRALKIALLRRDTSWTTDESQVESCEHQDDAHGFLFTD